MVLIHIYIYLMIFIIYFNNTHYLAVTALRKSKRNYVGLYDYY
jgi:hypothetical protein